MSKAFRTIVFVTLAALFLSACNNPAAAKPASFWPWTWGDRIWVQTTADAEESCATLGLEVLGINPSNGDPTCGVIAISIPVNGESVTGVTEKVVDDGYRKFRPDASWVGDDFGPEHTLPGLVNVLANAEIKPFMGFECALIRVNQGESLNVKGGGAYWEAGSVNAQIERWQHHVDEYTASYPGCKVYDSVAAFLLANPTYVR